MNEHDLTEVLRRVRIAKPVGVAGALARIGDAFHRAAIAIERAEGKR